MNRTIDESIPVAAPFATVRDLVEREPVLLLGVPAPDEAGTGPGRRALSEIGVELRGGASARHQVLVEVDPTVDAHGPDVHWPIRWQPTGHARLLPSFQGELRVVRDGEGAILSLRGSYRPPLGAVGAAGDSVLGRRVAHASAMTLLHDLAGRIEQEAARRTSAPAGQFPSNYSLIDPWPL
jgi:hypothetical protein